MLFQFNTDRLTNQLQRHRRESTRLVAVIENVPDGLVILDLNRRVLMMNTIARQLIGKITAFKKPDFRQLTAIATDTIGAAIAPGIHTTGTATRIAHNDKILQAQTAIIISTSGKQIGFIVTVQDISHEVAREKYYETLLDNLSNDVHVSISHIAQDAALMAVNQRGTLNSESLLSFARQIARNARAMQRNHYRFTGYSNL